MVAEQGNPFSYQGAEDFGLDSVSAGTFDLEVTPRNVLRMKMNHIWTAATLLLLTGCVSAPNVDVDKAAASRIKRIAILAMPEPGQKEIVVWKMGGGAALGLIGALIEVETANKYSKQFASVLEKRVRPLSEGMLSNLADSLAKDGYQTVVVRGQWPKLTSDKKSADFTEVHVDADAILCVSLSVTGYVSRISSQYYEPWVVINAELVDARTRQALYRKTINVGCEFKIKNVVHIPADAQYRFESFDDLMLHVDYAIAGLENCDRSAAARIATDLATR
jgi:hypothetical protein